MSKIEPEFGKVRAEGRFDQPATSAPEGKAGEARSGELFAQEG